MRLLTAMILILSLQAQGSLYQGDQDVQKFRFQTAKGSFTITATSSDGNIFEAAAMSCMEHLSAKHGSESENQILDIVDVCANPQRIQ